MSEQTPKPQPKGVLMVGSVPAVPLLLAIIWLVMTILYFTVGLSHKVSLPIVLGTIAWFVVWLFRANR